MRLPHRPKQIMKQQLRVDEPLYLTQGGVDKLERRLKVIKDTELPQAIEDVRRTGEFGDFSENAEYQEAKGRMRRLHSQVTSIEEKLKIFVLIKNEGVDEVAMGNTVVLFSQKGERREFEIVGPNETDPVNGRLSFKSPLGAMLMGRTLGEKIDLMVKGENVSYVIHEIK